MRSGGQNKRKCIYTKGRWEKAFSAIIFIVLLIIKDDTLDRFQVHKYPSSGAGMLNSLLNEKPKIQI